MAALLSKHEAGLTGLIPDSPTWNTQAALVADLREAYRLGTEEARPQAAVGAAFAEYFQTTHGNEFGHDHHCPGRGVEPCDDCSCGWSTLMERYHAFVDEG